MKEIGEIDNKKHECEFCNRKFIRESTLFNHICQYKHRWLERDKHPNRIGFQAWLEFYKKNTATKKTKTYQEFIKSPYYLAFAKFGTYCVDVNVLNVSRFIDWLLKNQIKLDIWATDKNYTNFLIEYLRIEDPLDALKRSVETILDMAKEESLHGKDYLRYGNKNKICYAITTGRISPWLIFQSKSGIEFIDNLDPTQIKMIIEYIDPEKWTLKFRKDTESVKTIKEILTVTGY